jgi:N-acetylmuramoyl-L-alanine amidase
VELRERRVALVLAAVSILAMISTGAQTFARDHGKIRDPNTITAIVIHTVGGPACISNAVRFRPIPYRDDDAQFWQRVLKAAPRADAHIVIGRNGKRADVLPITQVANHTYGANTTSIGIELVHRGDGAEAFSEPQIVKLIEVIKQIRQQYPLIRLENIVAHSDIDQRTCPCNGVIYRRRQDPGANFPMDRVLKDVQLPSDEDGRSSSLPPFTGAAPRSACVGQLENQIPSSDMPDLEQQGSGNSPELLYINNLQISVV